MGIFSFKGHRPNIHPSAYIAEGVQIVGDVTIDEDASVWFNSVIRGDENPVIIGRRTNIQDRSVIHTGFGHSTHIGEDVTVGHGATVHSATIEDLVLIGINAVVLDGATVGWGSVIAAGTVVLEGQAIPPRSFVVGVPGRVVRQVTDEHLRRLREAAETYVQRQRDYKASVRRLDS
jgi:carbonic anhydrase/acetyltransferase-like protein (isoleucine patch superfamily)